MAKIVPRKIFMNLYSKSIPAAEMLFVFAGVDFTKEDVEIAYDRRDHTIVGKKITRKSDALPGPDKNIIVSPSAKKFIAEYARGLK